MIFISSTPAPLPFCNEQIVLFQHSRKPTESALPPMVGPDGGGLLGFVDETGNSIRIFGLVTDQYVDVLRANIPFLMEIKGRCIFNDREFNIINADGKIDPSKLHGP